MSAFGKNIKKLSEFQKQKIDAERVEEIDVDLIDCEGQIRSKNNPGFTSESLMELANDIARDGQHEPVVLRKNTKNLGRYLMVAGERRWRACQLKGVKLKAIVRELSDEQAYRVQRAENIQRENLTQIEIATALRDDKNRFGTLERVSAEWNKSIHWVAERLKLLDVVEAKGYASHAVTEGVTTDITAINDLHRLESIDTEAAQSVLDQVQSEPDVNVRKAVREKLQEIKRKAKKPIASDQGHLSENALALVKNTYASTQALCEQYEQLSIAMQGQEDICIALNEAKSTLAKIAPKISGLCDHAMSRLKKDQ